MQIESNSKKVNMTLYLQQSRLFENFTAKEINNLIPAINPVLKDFKAGEVIMEESLASEKIGIILRGTVSGIRRAHSDEGHVLCFRRAGDTVGLFSYFSEDRKTFVEISAFSEVEAVIFDIKPLLEDENMKNKIYVSAGEEVIRLTRQDVMRLDALLSENSRERVEIFIRDNLDEDNIITFALSQEETARYLNINRTTFSKELNFLKKTGRLEEVTKRKYIYHGNTKKTT